MELLWGERVISKKETGKTSRVARILVQSMGFSLEVTLTEKSYLPALAPEEGWRETFTSPRSWGKSETFGGETVYHVVSKASTSTEYWSTISLRFWTVTESSPL